MPHSRVLVVSDSVCEKIHSLLNIASIFTNTVKFVGQDICPHDKVLWAN